MPAHVLLVDRDPKARRLHSEALGALGYSVLAARSAEEALTISRSQRVDLLLCDVALPGLSGIDLATRLRERSRNVGVVLLSDCLPDRRFVEAGVMFLSKPFELPQLRSAVEFALSHSALLTG